MADVELLINGQAYDGWKSVEVSRAIDAVAGAFSLELTERWAILQQPWQIRPGDACELRLDGERVIVGHVDAVRVSYDAQSHSVTVTGRDRTGDMVDCSAVHSPDQWSGVTLKRLAEILAEPFGIGVTSTADLGDAFPTVKLEHGETAWDALERHARQRGVLCLPDAAGGLLLAQPSSTPTSVRLVQGENILSASGELNHAERFQTYTVTGQAAGDDNWDAETSAHITGEATDGEVTRYRPMKIIAESLSTGASANKRAAWESTVRAGRSARLSVVVRGWRQRPDGDLWQVNQLVPVKSPWLQIDGLMLITGTTYRKTTSGTTTTLELMSPAAFRPDTTLRENQRDQSGDDQWSAW